MAHGGKREGAGRPKGIVSEAKRQISEMAKEYGETALQVLVDIAVNDQEPSSSRVSAAMALLDRGYGKPSQSVDVSNTDGTLATIDATKLTTEQKKALLAAMITDEPDTDAG